MRAVVLGAGKMGRFFARLLSVSHDVAVVETSPEAIAIISGQAIPGVKVIGKNEIRNFLPEMLLNCVPLSMTETAFREVMPFLEKDCLLCDITSVKGSLKDFYLTSGFRFVSTHPMFGPTFADLSRLAGENAVIISEGDEEGRLFFRKIYDSIGLNIREYTFSGHDRAMAYSLGVPFISTILFSSVTGERDIPGTTYKRHLAVAQGLFSEDFSLLSEILLNPELLPAMAEMRDKLEYMEMVIQSGSRAEVLKYLETISKEQNKMHNCFL